MTRSRSAVARSEWEARIRAQARSGMSIVAWCERAKVNAKYFYAWRKRLGTGTELVPIRVLAQASSSASESALAMTLSLGPAQLTLPVDTRAEWLATLLKSLQPC
jgi:hypothetical protein